jgi:growth factor-regulated tyrosine kinase substrate
MDNLVSLLRAPGAINGEVRGRMLELIQLWASAFDGNPGLSYVGDVYLNLKNEGFDFPPPTVVSSTFVDSSAVSALMFRVVRHVQLTQLQPPDWSDADVCMRCRTAFTFTNRKHHCRNCGSVFCGSCSSKSIPLPHIGIIQPVRVCDGCHTKLTERRVPSSIPKVLQSPKSQSSRRVVSSAMQPRSARVEQDDDEDLKRALQMSLEDVKGGTMGYVPHQQPTKKVESEPEPANATTVATVSAADDEDEELKAAIAASLRDMEEQKAKASWSTPAPIGDATARTATRIDRPDHELSPAEAENISLFATLVDRLQTQPPGTILREPQIQELYESIGALRPKLARTFGETMSKYGRL